MARLTILVTRRAAALWAGPQQHATLPRSGPLGQTLSSLLTSVAKPNHAYEVLVVLSSGDMACAEIAEVPFKSERAIDAVAMSLAESHCVQDTAEDLAVDVRMLARVAAGARVEVIAIRRALLDEIQGVVKKHLPKARIVLVTSLPSALACQIESKNETTVGVALPGELVVVKGSRNNLQRWRALPVSEAIALMAQPILQKLLQSFTDDADSIAWFPGDLLQLTERLNSIDVKRPANLMRSASMAPQGIGAKLRFPLSAACLSAASLFIVAALHFERQIQTYTQERERLEAVEEEHWKKTGQKTAFSPGLLSGKLKKAVQERAKTLEANQRPSALAFWAEMGSAFPSPEQTQLSLESLRLGGDEGLLIGQVPRANGADPLATAALLERSLDQPATLAAHGEFETRQDAIVVRLRLDYQPSGETPKSRGGRQ